MTSRKINQRIPALALASVFLLAGLAGSMSRAHGLGPAVILMNASYGTLGSYNGVKANLTSDWSTTSDLVVFAVWKNSAGQTVAVTTGGLTLATGMSGTMLAPMVSPLPSGTYIVSVFAVTTSDNPVSIVMDLYVTT